MNAILYLLPISLLLAVISLIAFFWTVRRNQYQDLDGDCLSALVDEDLPLARNTVDGKSVVFMIYVSKMKLFLRVFAD